MSEQFHLDDATEKETKLHNRELYERLSIVALLEYLKCSYRVLQMKGRTAVGGNLVAFKIHGTEDRHAGGNEIQFFFKSVQLIFAQAYRHKCAV